MDRSGLIASALLLVLLAGACGQAPPDAPDAAGSPTPATPTPATSTSPDDPNRLYEGTGLVLDTPDGAPEFCLGGATDSLPPQCGGIPLKGWDWKQVDDEERAGGTTWGTYHLVGRYDGDTFTVREAGPPEYDSSSDPGSIGTPCPEPAGGWKADDPARASSEDVVEAQRVVRRESDFAGLWVDYYNVPPGGPTEEDPGDLILNVAFTGDLERHESELRELWGGPLCLTQRDHTLRELKEIQQTFPADEFDLDVLWTSLDVGRGTVEIGVVVIDTETSKKIDDRYGEGVVKIMPRLKPVD